MAVAAIFDLDGTLVTFNLDIREWRRVLLDVMKRRGFDTRGLDLTTPTQQILDSAKSQSGKGRRRDFEDLRAEAFSILDSLELEGIKSATVLPDAADALAKLKSKGVRLCVLTNSGKAAAIRSLKKWDLLGYFEFVLTRDDTAAMKPRPEGIARAISMLRLRPSEVCYVGDSPLDIVAAKGAGVRVVSVATGNYTAERLRSEGADLVLPGLSSLPDVLGV